MFTNYSYEQRARHRDQRASTPIRWCCARNPFLRDSLLIGAGRRAHHQQGHAEHRPQHGRPADLPDHRQALHARRSTWPASAATPTSTSRRSRASGSAGRTRRMSLGMRAPGRVHPPVQRLDASCRSSRSCSSAASTASAASTSARIGPAGSDHRPRPRRQQEPAVQRRGADHDRRPGAADPVLRRRPGAGRARRLQDRRPSCRSASRSTTCSVPGQELQRGRTSRPRPALEIRFFMPVLNVPFRLIFAYNPQRDGRAATISFSPQKAFQFRFAVGSTF